MEECIFIDWGTTNARSHWIAKNGAVRASRQSHLGIRNTGDLGFVGAFNTLVADWVDSSGKRPPVLMSGMIGSRQGWIEAPYAHCPVAIDDLAARIIPVPDVPNAWIVPGVCLPPDGPNRDVMRGEEVQIFGTLELTGLETATLCLPGTHSKWARVEDGKLTDFATAMTGEVYQVMRSHSILGALIRNDTEHHAEAFARGLNASGLRGGLLNHLFSVRADGLFGVTPEDQQASYLSGLLIGHEIRALVDTYPADGDGVLLVASTGLANAYGAALKLIEIPFQTIDGEKASIKGLQSIWSTLQPIATANI